MKLLNLAEAETALHPYYEMAVATTGKDITLERSERLMAHVGNPEKALKIIHIAGTSGKTSTTYYVAALLQAAGQKVGHTVSPHVDSITERVQINGKPLSEQQFCGYLGEFLELVKGAPEVPSWFECLTGFALWVFAKEKVDYAVLETGLGGLQDSSNVAERSDKVCIITDIGFDHMHILGNTLSAIAYQKAGIIHDRNVALMYDQGSDVMRVVRYWVSQQEDAELLTFDQVRLTQAYNGEFVAGLPAYQKRNWLLAFAAYRFVAKRDELPILSPEQMLKTQRLQVPGRMDRRGVSGKTIIMDGAHNEQKVQAFVESFEMLFPGRKVPILLALKQGKEIETIAPVLSRIASQVIVTTFSEVQDLPQTSIDPETIVVALRANGVNNCAPIPSPHEAYRQFIASVDDIGVITGSFFLIAELRRNEKGLV